MKTTYSRARRVARARLAMIERAAGAPQVELALRELVEALGEAAEPPEHGMVAATIAHLVSTGCLRRRVDEQT